MNRLLFVAIVAAALSLVAAATAEESPGHKTSPEIDGELVDGAMNVSTKPSPPWVASFMGNENEGWTYLLHPLSKSKWHIDPGPSGIYRVRGVLLPYEPNRGPRQILVMSIHPLDDEVNQ